MSNRNHDHNSSLPARPPPGARPNGAARSYQNNTSYAPIPYTSAAPSYAPMMGSQPPYTAGGYQSSTYDPNGYYQQQQQQQYPAYTSAYTPTPAYTSSAPANAYPMQTTAQPYGKPAGYDYEEEARIAEWNSAYVTKDENSKKGHGNSFNAKTDTPATDGNAANSGVGAGKGKEKTVVRQGGGKKWEDASLLDWDPTHPRLFVGNLAGEVTDDSLHKAFSKYPSLSKARVVRDKRSTKSKSYGFVSFSDTDDYFKAAREMEGKYIGSHPVRVTRANTEIVAVTKRKEQLAKLAKEEQRAKGGKSGQKGGAGAKPATTYTGLGPMRNSGVQKHSKKNNGPRLLG